MSIFPRDVPIFANCRYCEGIARIPPGVYYEGEPYCRMCAMILAYEDHSQTVDEPYFDELEDVLRDLIDADRSVNPWR